MVCQRGGVGLGDRDSSCVSAGSASLQVGWNKLCIFGCGFRQLLQIDYLDDMMLFGQSFSRVQLLMMCILLGFLQAVISSWWDVGVGGGGGS